MPARHVALAAAVAVLWGVNFVVIHVGLDAFPPLLFACLRFTLVAFPAVLFLPRPGVPVRYVLGVGTFLSALQFGLLFVGMHEGMPAGLASLVLQLQVLFTIGLAIVLLGERPSARQNAGALVALVGIAVIAMSRTQDGVPLGAFMLAVGAAASWGIGNVIARQAQAPSPIGLLVWSSLVPPIPLGLLSLWLEGPERIGGALGSVDISGALALLYVIVVATGFGFGSWTWLMRQHPASRVAPFSLIVPVAGIASAWIALGERPGAIELAGSAVVLAGLALVMQALRPPRSRVATPVAATEPA
jgi:O-acetylserine/cysteine efflux transporter